MFLKRWARSWRPVLSVRQLFPCPLLNDYRKLRPSDTPFAQPTTLDHNFVMGTTSPSISFPSRLPRSPLRSPKKTFRQGEHAAKACGSAPSTPKLNKRRASNLPTDSPPKKSHSGRVARKSNDDDGDGNCGDRDAGIEDNGEVQREEVLKSLLLPVTPSSAAQRHSHLRPVCPT
jgi:hypothetical protein